MGKEHSDSERGNHLRLYMGYVFRLAARDLSKAPYVCHTIRRVLAGTRSS